MLKRGKERRRARTAGIVSDRYMGSPSGKFLPLPWLASLFKGRYQKEVQLYGIS